MMPVFASYGNAMRSRKTHRVRLTAEFSGRSTPDWRAGPMSTRLMCPRAVHFMVRRDRCNDLLYDGRQGQRRRFWILEPQPPP